jgi:hypothetical protein
MLRSGITFAQVIYWHMDSQMSDSYESGEASRRIANSLKVTAKEVQGGESTPAPNVKAQTKKVPNKRKLVDVVPETEPSDSDHDISDTPSESEDESDGGSIKFNSQEDLFAGSDVGTKSRSRDRSKRHRNRGRTTKPTPRAASLESKPPLQLPQGYCIPSKRRKMESPSPTRGSAHKKTTSGTQPSGAKSTRETMKPPDERRANTRPEGRRRPDRRRESVLSADASVRGRSNQSARDDVRSRSRPREREDTAGRRRDLDVPTSTYARGSGRHVTTTWRNRNWYPDRDTGAGPFNRRY